MAIALAEIELHASERDAPAGAARVSGAGELARTIFETGVRSRLVELAVEDASVEDAFYALAATPPLALSALAGTGTTWARANAHTESLFPSSGGEGGAP